MKNTILLMSLFALPCMAGFDGFTEKSYGDGRFLKTKFTTSGSSEFHLGCGLGTDNKLFTIIGLRDPVFYQLNGAYYANLSIDEKDKTAIHGGTRRYDDMYYAKNPIRELLKQIRVGNTVNVNFLNQSLSFSLLESNQAYKKLLEECGSKD
ncbi:hypothetical protein ACPV5J_07540 [Vibrio rotiferianus]|uniref:hypothetical protein n=1 Tax=Vibrio rotiferianus TaxID=190895 RepID=UPI00406A57F2